MLLLPTTLSFWLAVSAAEWWLLGCSDPSWTGESMPAMAAKLPAARLGRGSRWYLSRGACEGLASAAPAAAPPVTVKGAGKQEVLAVQASRAR